MNPSIGRIVHYKLTAEDASAISRRRINGAVPDGWPAGAQAHVGNPVSEGQDVPAIITAVWPNEYGDQPGVNAQVFLDGNDSFWITYKKEGTLPGEWAWPPRI